MTEIDWARVPVRELKQSSSTRKRGQGFLYIDDMDWIRRAYEVTKSKAQFAYALLLHRHCRLRKQAGEHPAVASRAVRAGFGISHDVATRALRRLARAGLIQVEGRPGSAYRVSILKPRKLEFEPPIKPVRIVAIHESSEAQPPNQSRNPTLIRVGTLRSSA